MNRLSRRIQPAIALQLLLGSVLSATSAAANPGYSVSLNNAIPQIGKVTSGSVATSFVVSASGGGISISPAGGSSGQFIPFTDTGRSSSTTFIVTCSGTKCGQASQTSVLTITGTSTVSGRFGQISGINIVTPAGLINGGGTTASTVGSTLTVTLAPFTGSKTIAVGMSVPVATTGSLGTAASTWTVVLGNSSLGSSQAQGTVEGRLSIVKNSDLSYGTLVLNQGVSGSAVWDASANTFSLSPVNLAFAIHGGATIAQFTVSGTPFQQLNFSIPSTIKLFNAANNELDIAVATTGQGTQSVGNTGTFSFRVGGSIPITSGMHTGQYTGVFTVTSDYQ